MCARYPMLAPPYSLAHGNAPAGPVRPVSSTDRPETGCRGRCRRRVARFRCRQMAHAGAQHIVGITQTKTQAAIHDVVSSRSRRVWPWRGVPMLCVAGFTSSPFLCMLNYVYVNVNSVIKKYRQAGLGSGFGRSSGRSPGGNAFPACQFRPVPLRYPVVAAPVACAVPPAGGSAI